MRGAQDGHDEPDARAVARALAAGIYPQLGDQALSDVLSFGAELYAAALGDAGRMLNKQDPQSDDVRCLFASSRIAFNRGPAAYADVDVHGRIQRRIPRRAGVRSEASLSNRQLVDRLEAHERQRGDAMFDSPGFTELSQQIAPSLA